MSVQNKLAGVQSFLEFFSNVDKAFKLRHVEIFLAIIRHQMEHADIPLTQQDLIERYCINASTASRDVEYLGEGREGLNLISTVRLPTNRKINEVRLTEKGEELKQKVLELLAA